SREGVEIIKRLAVVSDVIVENYIPGKLDQLGLGYTELSKSNPKLIYASITGYGPTGPYAQRAGYDVIIEAEAGLMHITGEPDGNPVKVGVAITDMVTGNPGLYTHGAIMAALLARSKSGVGQKIDASLLVRTGIMFHHNECQVATLANIGHSHLIGGLEGKRWGTAHASIVPYQVFETSDGFVVFGAGNDKQYQKVMTALGRTDLAEKEKFKTNSLRVEHRNELIPIIQEIFLKHCTDYWLKILEPLGVPFAPVNNLQQTFAHPQVIHRNMVQDIDHPKSGKVKLIGPAVKYSDTPATIRQPPPTLGQHNSEVLEDLLNYRSSDVERFKNEGII
ncbi:hypothetical protein HK096_009524, partial [Nowakowskiella sp. JEL0078]